MKRPGIPSPTTGLVQGFWEDLPHWRCDLPQHRKAVIRFDRPTIVYGQTENGDREEGRFKNDLKEVGL